MLFYRDGVSEGQFKEVLEHEVAAIRAVSGLRVWVLVAWLFYPLILSGLAPIVGTLGPCVAVWCMFVIWFSYIMVLLLKLACCVMGSSGVAAGT